ncbi:MAG: thioredoxin domain-containing protein [Thiomonas sp.]
MVSQHFPSGRSGWIAWLRGAALCFLFAGGVAAQAATPRTNHLSDSHDPYLQEHAHDPVDWYPWGAQALDEARRENKPIYLSIGYSACYWCHVAQRELYRNPQIAALMNRWFVNVLVDREQRPDIDHIYMLARQIMTRDSGWPNNVFLTPDLQPFYIGSYFPPKATAQQEGFPTLLATLHKNWTQHPAEVKRIAAQIAQAMQAAAISGDASAPIDPAAWTQTAQTEALHRFDALDGGFASATSAARFPQPPLLAWMLARGGAGEPKATYAAVFTLQAMAQGGLMDQLGGGFRRYAVDPGWSVPHFEMMLSDNAQLLSVYARAYAQTRLPDLRWTAQRTARFLLRDLRLPQGVFATAIAAETGGVEGATDLWTTAQIDGVLGPQQAQAWFALYALTTVHPGSESGVLRQRRDVAEHLLRQGQWVARLEQLAPQRRALLAARNHRPQPRRDDKIVTADNAMAIRALAQAGMVLDDRALTEAAVRAADWEWQHAWNPRQRLLVHQWAGGHVGNPGFLDDYAELARAYLTLASVQHDARWSQRASDLVAAMLQRFAAPDGSLRSAPTSDALPFPTPLQGDVHRPSGQSAAIAVLLELAQRTGQAHWADAARRALRPLALQVQARPLDWPDLLQTLGSAAGRAVFASPQQIARIRPADCSGLPQGACSSDRVQVKWLASDRLQLHIAPSFHINANPATEPNLIATTVLAGGQPLPGVSYPPPQQFRPAFAPQGIAVWEGRVTLDLPALTPAQRAALALRVQACNATTCLAPSVMPISAPTSSPPQPSPQVGRE